MVLYWIPFKISFGYDRISQLLYGDFDNQLELILLSVFVLDAIVGMNISYIHKGIISKSKKKAFINYI